MVETNTGPRNRKRLGRGLASLMSQPVAVAPEPGPQSKHPRTDDQAQEAGKKDEHISSTGLLFLALATIQPSPYQPRKQIDPARLEALAASIRQSGVMQPVLVRPREEGGYELIAGERRWRAAQLAGMTTLPAIIRELTNAQTAEWALVENLQREDLDPIERAEAFQSLVSEFSLTHSQIAERVGIDRSSVANTIRLNTLDEETKQDLRAGRLSPGHAKVLLSVADPTLRRALAKSVLRDGWTVRRLEREVESCLKAEDGVPRAAGKRTKAPHITELEERLSRALQLPARISQSANKNRGQIIFTFNSLDQFEAFLSRVEQ